jgi:serine/threonine protein kinase
MESCELAHSVVGRPLYMSPELCLLSLSRPYDHKSDVWALGCVLYELTSLRRPFSAQGFAQLIMSVLRGRCAPIPLQARLPPFGARRRPPASRQLWRCQAPQLRA